MMPGYVGAHHAVIFARLAIEGGGVEVYACAGAGVHFDPTPFDGACTPEGHFPACT